MMSHTAAVEYRRSSSGCRAASSPRHPPARQFRRPSRYSCEAIRYGHADVMIAGGAEELCPTMAIVFDTLFATSCRNDAPHTAPKPL